MTWLTPVTSPSDSLTRKIESLVALAGSIAPLKGIEIRGCTLKPSSSFRTSTSRQSEGKTAQFGLGSATRSPVSCVASGSV